MQTLTLFPGVILQHYPDDRFKNQSLSIQLVRPMCREEAALNALLPAVLLRGCEGCPDLRDITFRLDDLYGASVGTLVRRVGDYQTTGFYCGFMDDRFAQEGEEILSPLVELVGRLLLRPVMEGGAFRRDYVEGEKKNLISSIESQLNDKRSYANAQMLKKMCPRDSFGIPRLGEAEDAAAITPQSLYEHYRAILRSSTIRIFYVGSAKAEVVARLLTDMFRELDRDYVNLKEQTPFLDAGGGEYAEEMAVAQGKLAMGYVTPTTIRDDGFVAMQLLNLVFGGGMTGKLFMHLREKLSLCYAIGSAYHGAKGILTVSAGIDSRNEGLVREQIAAQLEACCRGEISPAEMAAAKEAMCSALRATHDSPGAIENYYASAALSGLKLTPEAYMRAVEATTAEQVAEAARSLRLHTVYFLKGVEK